jgi:hypothetical protein
MTRNDTRREFVRTATATVAGLSAVGVASAEPQATAVTLSESFDAMDRTWSIEGDPAETSTESAYDVGLVENTYSGNRHVQYDIDGTGDQGTVWIRSTVDVEPGTAYEGEFSVNGYTPEASYNQLSSLRAYVGPDQPQQTSDFPDERENFNYNNDGGLKVNPWETSGWDQYDQMWETPEYDTDQLHIAVGFSTNWETQFQHLVDNVELTLTPE